jgi:hypothetical protein
MRFGVVPFRFFMVRYFFGRNSCTTWEHHLEIWFDSGNVIVGSVFLNIVITNVFEDLKQDDNLLRILRKE